MRCTACSAAARPPPRPQIHSHGTWFWVVAAGLAGDGDYKGQPLVATLPRDTGTINAQSYAVLRYLATNPGSWFVHCQ